jgi:hypothetical protein
MKMTRTHIYLIKVEIMLGTNPAVEIVLVICSLVSRVKLYNVCIVYRTTTLSLMQNYALSLRVVPIGSNSW